MKHIIYKISTINSIISAIVFLYVLILVENPTLVTIELTVIYFLISLLLNVIVEYHDKKYKSEGRKASEVHRNWDYVPDDKNSS